MALLALAGSGVLFGKVVMENPAAAALTHRAAARTFPRWAWVGMAIAAVTMFLPFGVAPLAGLGLGIVVLGARAALIGRILSAPATGAPPALPAAGRLPRHRAPHSAPPALLPGRDHAS